MILCYIKMMSHDCFDKLQIPYVTMVDDKMKLKKNSSYYYQVQGQLKITKRNVCYFVVYSEKWIEYDVIEYDESFWYSKMDIQLETYVDNTNI